MPLLQNESSCKTLSHENTGKFELNEYERFRTKTHFDTEAKGNSNLLGIELK